MYGFGIVKGLGVTLKHLVESYIEDFRYLGRRYTVENLPMRQGLQERGIFTVQYPEEKLPVPEEFRFTPFLLYEDETGEDRCTSCGICAKVCPPQCIWIVRSNDPKTGKPIPAPKEFYIDVDICMNCGFCAEFCPFDAIKMDHDFELATYDRTSTDIFDKKRLSKPVSYYATIRPTNYAREEAARTEKESKSKKPAQAPTSRPTAKPPVSGTPQSGEPDLVQVGKSGPTPVSPEEKRGTKPGVGDVTGQTEQELANAPRMATQQALTADDRERLKAAAMARKAGKGAPATQVEAASSAPAPSEAPKAGGLSAEERERLKAAALARKAGGTAPAAPKVEEAAPAATPAPKAGGLSAEERERLKAAALARKAGGTPPAPPAPVAAAPVAAPAPQPEEAQPVAQASAPTASPKAGLSDEERERLKAAALARKAKKQGGS